MVALGRFAVLLAVGAAAWGLIGGFIGARSGRVQIVRSAEGAIKAAAIALTVAAVVLFRAFLAHDFSVKYVAEYSSRALSKFYLIGAFWAGQPGSLLLWAWVLSLYGAVVVWQNRSKNRHLMPWVVTVISGALLAFAGMMAFLSNPFDTLPFTPPDGQGLNPLLQNYGQFFHPVTLYMGYVGFTVPFAFCVAALATGDLSDTWIRTVRKWTLWSWILLTAGIMFGARWAYVELGWGGYWAWDPVENASLMPWLMATAYLHSVMIQEKRGMLKVWNVFLIAATFTLSIFGTFLTRSGIIGSVHSFAESPIGGYLLGAIVITVLVSGILIAWRLPDLRGGGRFDSVVSRESSFLLNNLLLLGITFAIFWGTVFPLVAAAVRGVKVTVGPPFFETVVTPMGVALLALAGICPLIAWRKASLKNLRRNFLIPTAAGIAGFVSLMALNGGDHVGVAVVFGLAVFVAVTISVEYYRGARARSRMRGERAGVAFSKLFAKNPRRYGGYLIHLGVVLLLAGVAFNIGFKRENRVSLQIGQSAKVAGYQLTLRDVRNEETPAKFSTIATLDVSDTSGTRDLGSIETEKSMYVNQEQPTTEVGIRSSAREDLYVILESFDPEGGVASLALIVNPGMFWIWVGALVVLGGGVIVAWPSRKPAPALVTEEVTDAPRRIPAGVGVAP